MAYTPKSKRKTFLSRNRKQVSQESDIENLIREAQRRGMKVDTEPKESLFRRGIDIISRPNYASAGFAKALVKGDENPIKEAWKGFKGEDKETYSDVLSEAGVKNKWVKGGVGLALDIALDPLTYLGGTAIKFAGKGAKGVAKVAGQGAMKVAPESATKFAQGGKLIKEGFQDAFSYYKTGVTREVADLTAVQKNKLSMVGDDVDDMMLKYMGKFKNNDEMIKAQEIFWNNSLIEGGFKKGKYGAGKTAEQKEIIKMLQLMGKESAELMEITNPRKWYFPGISIKKLSESAEGIGSLTKAKGLHKKQWGNLIADEDLLKDSKKAFAIVFKRGMEDRLKTNFLENIVSTYGTKSIGVAAKGGRVTKGGLDDVITKSKAEGKSFEEFVGKQEHFYHGTSESIVGELTSTKKLRKAGKEVKASNIGGDSPFVHITEDKNLAGKYASARTRRFGGEKQIKEGYFDGKILDKTDDVSVSFNSLERSEPSLMKEIKDGGYVGVRFKDVGSYGQGVNTTAIFPEHLKTKSQLKKLWNKAGAKATGLTDDAARIATWAEEGIKPVPIYKKGAMSFFKREGDTALGATKAKPIGYVKETDARWLKEALSPEMGVIDKLAKVSGFDAFTRFFKTAVTAYFPAFHIRNAASGVVQNYSVFGAQAFNPFHHKRGLSLLMKGGDNEMLKVGGKMMSRGELKKAFVSQYRGSSRYIHELEDFAEQVASGTFKMKKIGKARQIGNGIEMWQKATGVSIAIEQGKSLKQAFKLAEKAGFDYSKISKFEQKIMKRMVPFYTFARKNAALQLSTLAKNPERILNQSKFANALSNAFGSKVTEEDLKGLPDWVLGSLGFKIEGDKYVSKLGLPVEEFTERVNDFFGSSMSSMNPIIKYNLEARLGYDFFREKDIVDLDKISPVTGEILWNAKKEGKLPKWFNDSMNVQKSSYKGKVRYTASPQQLHRLRNLPISRFQNTLEKIFDEDIDTANKLVGFLSGGKIYDIDQEMQKYYRDRDLKRDIEDQLLKMGEGDRFEKFYFPKQKEIE